MARRGAGPRRDVERRALISARVAQSLAAAWSRCGPGITALADLLMPRACAACERLLDEADRGIVCGRCWSRLRPLPAPQCARCGHPVREPTCRWCALLPAYVRAVRSYCWLPGGSASAIVHALKYDGWAAVAAGLGERMARLAWPADVVEERALVVPVPLAGTRLRERGYNQSELIARTLAERWRVPVAHDVLERVRGTRSQTRLTPSDRARNVSGAFRAVDAARRRIARAHIVLVDDVVTTAATLNACAVALLEGGARIVSYATFGRAPSDGDR